MKLSKGQRDTKILIEENLGHPIPEYLLMPFFSKIDKGIQPEIANSPEFSEILFSFRMIAYDYNQYVEDFKHGLLFLSDFEGDCVQRKKLALRAYRSAMGYDTSLLKAYEDKWGSNLVDKICLTG